MDEQDSTVVCANQRISRSGLAQLGLDAMARVEPGPVDLFGLALDATDLAPDTRTAFIVTGPHRPFIDLQRTAGQFPPEVSRVVVVVDPRGHGVRHGGGLVILTSRGSRTSVSVLVSGVAR